MPASNVTAHPTQTPATPGVCARLHSCHPFKHAMRILLSVISFVVLVVLVNFILFVLLDLLPGNAASQALGFTGTTDSIAVLTHQWGLDAPVLDRFITWGSGVVTGNLGTILGTNKPVAEALAGPFSRTAVMFAASFIITTIAGVGLGIFAGLHAKRPSDRAVSTLSLVIISLPEFIIAIMLVFFLANTFKLLPAVSLMPVGGSAFSTPIIFVLPVVTMSLMGTASMVRNVRPVVAQESQSLHVESAYLAGVSTWRIVWRHVLPGCLSPIAQSLAKAVPYLIGGTAVIETVFNFPGMGSLLVNSVKTREPNMVMACALIMTTLSLFAFWGADLFKKRP